jgi:hypothetical protein
MPQIKELEITTNEDAEKVHEFAVENAGFLAMSLSDIATAVHTNDMGRAVARYSVHILEAYVSGLSEGIERGKKEALEGM